MNIGFHCMCKIKMISVQSLVGNRIVPSFFFFLFIHKRKNHFYELFRCRVYWAQKISCKQIIIIIIKGTTKPGIRYFITFYITLFRFVRSIFGSLDLWIFGSSTHVRWYINKQANTHLCFWIIVTVAVLCTVRYSLVITVWRQIHFVNLTKASHKPMTKKKTRKIKNVRIFS